jgi:hypothetical protein
MGNRLIKSMTLQTMTNILLRHNRRMVLLGEEAVVFGTEALRQSRWVGGFFFRMATALHLACQGNLAGREKRSFLLRGQSFLLALIGLAIRSRQM